MAASCQYWHALDACTVCSPGEHEPGSKAPREQIVEPDLNKPDTLNDDSQLSKQEAGRATLSLSVKQGSSRHTRYKL